MKVKWWHTISSLKSEYRSRLTKNLPFIIINKWGERSPKGSFFLKCMMQNAPRGKNYREKIHNCWSVQSSDNYPGQGTVIPIIKKCPKIRFCLKIYQSLPIIHHRLLKSKKCYFFHLSKKYIFLAILPCELQKNLIFNTQ